MTTKSNRHAMVTVTCDWCGTLFEKRKQRVQEGKGNFCSREHLNEWQRGNRSSEKVGKENATVHWDKARGGYIAVWRDSDTHKLTSTTWGKWAWELNFGEIPDGYKIGYKDGNPENISLDNLICQSPEELGQKISEILTGREVSNETKKKLSKAHTGKTLSESHKNKIAQKDRELWSSGVYDDVHKGENSKYWKGGVTKKPYPPEFYSIAPFIKDRDNHVCQICGKNVYRSRHGHVHHIDGDKKNNDPNNLILLCSACHSKVHHPTKETPATILAFSSQLKF